MKIECRECVLNSRWIVYLDYFLNLRTSKNNKICEQEKATF